MRRKYADAQRIVEDCLAIPQTPTEGTRNGKTFRRIPCQSLPIAVSNTTLRRTKRISHLGGIPFIATPLAGSPTVVISTVRMESASYETSFPNVVKSSSQT